jgi:hypothetical protein
VLVLLLEGLKHCGGTFRVLVSLFFGCVHLWWRDAVVAEARCNWYFHDITCSLCRKKCLPRYQVTLVICLVSIWVIYMPRWEALDWLISCQTSAHHGCAGVDAWRTSEIARAFFWAESYFGEAELARCNTEMGFRLSGISRPNCYNAVRGVRETRAVLLALSASREYNAQPTYHMLT